MNVVMIVPTGIGCEIGGHCGDGNAPALLLGACCETLVLHPNVVNASDINEMPPNALYVEGNHLDRFLQGKLFLQKVKSNKVLVVVNKADYQSINAVSAARITLGLEAEILELKAPLKLIFLEMALSYAGSRSLDPIQKDVLQKWESVIESLGRDPMELDTKIDWIIKKRMIESYMSRKKLDWSDSQVQMLDLQYHDLRPDKGLYFLLERQGKVERIVTDEEIQHAVYHPPVDTRAYFRGECLRRYPGEVFGVNWDSISFGLGADSIKRVMMSEPLKGTKQFVESLLDRSKTAAQLLENMQS